MASQERTEEPTSMADLRRTLEGKSIDKTAQVNLARRGVRLRIEEITETIADQTVTRAFIAVDAPSKRRQGDQVYRIQIAEKNAQGEWEMADGVKDLLEIDLTGRRPRVSGSHVKKKIPVSTALRPGKVGLWKAERDFHVDNLLVRREPQDPHWRQQLGAFHRRQGSQASVFRNGLKMQGRETVQKLQSQLYAWLSKKFQEDPRQLSETVADTYSTLIQLEQRGQFKDTPLTEISPEPSPPPVAPEPSLSPEEIRQSCDQQFARLRQKIHDEGEASMDYGLFDLLLRYGTTPPFEFTIHRVTAEDGGPRMELRADNGNVLASLSRHTSEGQELVEIDLSQASLEFRSWLAPRFAHLLSQLGVTSPDQVRLTDLGGLCFLSSQSVASEVPDEPASASAAPAQGPAGPTLRPDLPRRRRDSGETPPQSREQSAQARAAEVIKGLKTGETSQLSAADWQALLTAFPLALSPELNFQAISFQDLANPRSPGFVVRGTIYSPDEEGNSVEKKVTFVWRSTPQGEEIVDLTGKGLTDQEKAYLHDCLCDKQRIQNYLSNLLNS